MDVRHTGIRPSDNEQHPVSVCDQCDTSTFVPHHTAGNLRRYSGRDESSRHSWNHCRHHQPKTTAAGVAATAADTGSPIGKSTDRSRSCNHHRGATSADKPMAIFGHVCYRRHLCLPHPHQDITLSAACCRLTAAPAPAKPGRLPAGSAATSSQVRDQHPCSSACCIELAEHWAGQTRLPPPSANAVFSSALLPPLRET